MNFSDTATTKLITLLPPGSSPRTSTPGRDGRRALGWCHYQLRHSQEAVRLFSSAVGMSPNSISDWFDLGLALLSAGAES